jgi:hypothetical protein
MGRADFYKKGQWLAICDVCGMKYHSGDLKKRWDGLMCCPQDWNPRQPQDFVRGIPDPQAPPWTRPDVQPQFIYNPVTYAVTDLCGNALYDFSNNIITAFATSTIYDSSINPDAICPILQLGDGSTVGGV